jgi:transporter family protein
MQWVILGLLAALGAAGVAVLGRVGLQRVDTLMATTLRSLVMSVALVALTLARGGLRQLASGQITLDARAWAFVVGAGVCGAGSWLAYFAALKIGNAGAVAALDRMSLPLVFVLALAFLGEHPGWRGWAGLALVVGGTALIVWDQAARAAA